MDFIGEKCAACGNKFTEDDDIIVCPECGSPHHRDCYKKENKCANISLHASGEKWKRSSDTEKDNMDDKPLCVCPVCRFPNKDGEENCVRCGARLKADVGEESTGEAKESRDPFDQYSGDGYGVVRPYLGFNPEEDMGGATLKEVSQFVGTNTLYYIPIFKQMKDFGTKLSFNISCLIFPPLYFANRRMWGWAIITALVSVILNLPSAMLMITDYLEGSEGTEALLSLVYDNKNFINTLDTYFSIGSWILSIVLCLFGNWLYYRYVLRSLRRMKSESPDGSVTFERIASVGGVRPINILLMAIIMSGISLAALYGAFQLMNMSGSLKILMLH